MKECRERLLVGKITGAVGTAPSYGPPDLAIELQIRICQKLGLGVPPITESEVTRDRVAEFVNVMAMVSTTMEKLARDIWNQQRPEIDELAEPFRTGEQVGSSTCAHKRNPFGCEWIMGTAKMVRAHAYPVNELYCPDVRDGSRLAVEYSALPACCLMTSAILQSMSNILTGLTIKPENMRRNVLLSQGLCMDESVMLVLAEKIGRQSAHDLVYKCSMRAFEEGLTFKETLLETSTVTKHLTADQIEDLTVPDMYLGTATHQVEATIKAIREAREKDR
jgi:adenylosuccinate lyase